MRLPKRDIIESRPFLLALGAILVSDLVVDDLVLRFTGALPWWGHLSIHLAAVALVAVPLIWFVSLHPVTAGTRREAARASAILEASSDAIVSFDAEGRIETFSPAAERMSGWNEAEIVGQSFTLLLPEASRRHRMLEFALDLRDPVNRFPRSVGEIELLRRDGSTFIVDLVASGFQTDGRWTIFAVARDVSERKHVQAQLKQALDRTEAILNGMQESHALLDREWRYRYANDSAATTVGLTREEVLGRCLWEFYPDAIGTEIERKLRDAMDNHSITTFEIYDARGAKWWEVRNQPVPEGLAMFGIDITERKRAAEEIAFRNLILSTQQEVSIDAILVVDEHDHILSYNRRFIAMMKVPQELVDAGIDEPVLRHVTGQMADPEAFVQRVRELYERRDLCSQDEVQLADGRILDRYSSPMAGPDGRYFGRVWFFRDVTERRVAEERLRTMSRVIEQNPASIVITNTAGEIEYVNPKFCAITGYTREEAIGQNPRILKSGQVQPEVYHKLWEVIRHGHEWRGELLNRKKNGELFWESAIIAGVTDERGEVTHFVAVKEDISERKQAEIALRESERRFQMAFNHAPIGIGLVSPEGRILRVNQAMCDFIGYSAEQLTTMNLDRVSHPDDMPADTAQLRRVLTSQIPSFTMEKRYQRRDGQIRWGMLHVTLVRDDAGKPLYFIRQLLDITSRKEAEHTLQRWAKTLATTNRQLKAEREARERAETDLRLSQKLEAIGQLAAGIAHEINTPMQYIGDSGKFLEGAHADLLAMFDAYRDAATELAAQPGRETLAAALERLAEERDVAFAREEIPNAIARIGAGVERVSVIVRAMKEFAHPGQQEHVAADINHMIQNTLIIARNEYKHVAELVTDLQPLPMVSCNVGEMNQVFLNILVNASHAIAEKQGKNGAPGTIIVRTRLEEDAIAVEFEDSGPGIPDSIHERVFDPFFTTKPPGRGTGQGLAIARSIVRDRHGGELSFTTQPGVGTVFRIRLPNAAKQESKELAA